MTFLPIFFKLNKKILENLCAKAAATNIVFMKKGRTEVIEQQNINQHLCQRTECYEALEVTQSHGRPRLEQNPATVTG